MGNLQNLLSDIWYGDKPQESIDSLIERIEKATDSEECVLTIAELLKSGYFSIKPLLIQLMNQTKSDPVRNLCIRLFASVANHNDLIKYENMYFLENMNERTFVTFISCVPRTLSFEIVPYLLALLDTYDEQEIKQIIRFTLDDILSYTELLEENASVNEINDFYNQKADNLDESLYHYKGLPVFPGDLTKELSQRILSIVDTQEEFQLGVEPSLLSIWSGEKCPVEYHSIITSEMYYKVIDYINLLSEKDYWEVGCKYFYGHKIPVDTPPID